MEFPKQKTIQVWMLLAHFDQNYAFIMRRLDFVLYAISILLDNRATATDVLHLSTREIPIEFLLFFKLEEKSHL